MWNLIQWIQYVRGAFDELSEIRLFGEQKMLTLTRGSLQPMAVQLHMFRESFTIDQAKAHCRDAQRCMLSFASMGSGACIGLQGVLRTRQWMPRWGAESVPPVKRQTWEAATTAPSFADVLLLSTHPQIPQHQLVPLLPPWPVGFVWFIESAQLGTLPPA